jgi:hypothetical protein
MKIRPVGAELFHADTRADMTKLTQADPLIRGFSIRRLTRPEKIWKIKELSSS